MSSFVVPNDAREAREVLIQIAGRRTQPVPSELVVDHVLALPGGWDWPVRRAALEALLRRFASVRAQELAVVRAPARAPWGPYLLSRGDGEAPLPYDVRLWSLAPLAGSCGCADFVRAELGLCKHLIAVLAHLARKPRVFGRLADTWTVIPSPPGHDCNIASAGDAPSVVLPSGSILTQVGAFGNVSSDPVYATASLVELYSPSTNTWIPGVTPSASTPNLEEAALTILQDGTVFTMDAANDGQTCYRYDSTIASGNPWLPCARPSSQLGSGYGGRKEIGPQLLLYSGQVLVLGDKTPGASTANIGLYTPPPPSNRIGAGTWATNLPAIPSGLAFADLGSCVMPNGKVLIEGSRTGDAYFSFWEYDPAANTFMKASPTPTFPETAMMVVLPTGQILVVNGPSSIALWLYTPDGSPNPAWKPSIAGPISGPDASGLYTLTGTQLAGLTTGGGFGDDAQTDSNYPILRMTPKGQTSPVHYLQIALLGDRTPAPGNTTSVKFVVPSAVPDGDYVLQVVTNGIASDPLGQGAPFHWAATVGGRDAAMDAPADVGDATVSPDGGDARSGHDAPDAAVFVDAAPKDGDASDGRPNHDGSEAAIFADAAPKDGDASDGGPNHDGSDAAVFADAGSGREKVAGAGCGCSVQSGRPRNPSGPIWGTLLAGLALVIRRAGRRH